MNSQLQLVTQDKVRINDECVSLRIEKVEAEHISMQLWTQKQEVEQESEKLRQEKRAVEEASARIQTEVMDVLMAAIEQVYEADMPLKDSLTKGCVHKFGSTF